MNSKPNILLFFTDQHRLSALGCYGPTPCRTPNIDNLASTGTRFDKTYTTYPVCSPARATIMTGMLPHGHGVTANIHEIGCVVHELPDDPKLLSRELEAAGYANGYTGKWHLGTDAEFEPVCNDFFKRPNQPSLPRDVGFTGHNFPGHGEGGFFYPEYEAYLAENGWEHKVRPHATDGPKITGHGILEGPKEATVPYFLGSHTIDLIDQFHKQDTPFFIWHNHWGPHGPYYIPQEYYDMYRNTEIPRWPNYHWPNEEADGVHRVYHHPDYESEIDWRQWEDCLRYYYGFTTLIDEQLGRIRDHLDNTGLAENTIVIFASDHGETTGSHAGLINKGFSHFEEVQRIGLIIHDPRRPEGRVEERLVSLADLYPTILELAGATWDRETIHGRSLVPLLDQTPCDWRDSVFVEFFGLSGKGTALLTCRHGDIKYGWTYAGRDELYDLARDPHETHNLLDDPNYQNALFDMRRRIYTFMEESGYPNPNDFLRTTLQRHVDRQYIAHHDPQPLERYRIPMAW